MPEFAGHLKGCEADNVMHDEYRSLEAGIPRWQQNASCTFSCRSYSAAGFAIGASSSSRSASGYEVRATAELTFLAPCHQRVREASGDPLIGVPRCRQHRFEPII